jgi:hypothetical protein
MSANPVEEDRLMSGSVDMARAQLSAAQIETSRNICTMCEAMVAVRIAKTPSVRRAAHQRFHFAQLRVRDGADHLVRLGCALADAAAAVATTHNEHGAMAC